MKHICHRNFQKYINVYWCYNDLRVQFHKPLIYEMYETSVMKIDNLEIQKYDMNIIYVNKYVNKILLPFELLKSTE